MLRFILMRLRIGASLGLDYKYVVLFAKSILPFDSNAKNVYVMHQNI